MTVTYDPSAISEYEFEPISAIRFLIADTDTAQINGNYVALISDEEITALLSKYEDTDYETRVLKAAIDAAKYILRVYSHKVNFNSAGTSVSYSDLAKQFQSVISELSNRLAAKLGDTGVIYAYRPRSYTW